MPAVIVWCVLAINLASSFAEGQTTTQPSSPHPGPQTAESIENEVHENMLNQSIGGQTVRDLNLPDPFVRRATDRIVRASYEQRYRIVVQDSAGVAGMADKPADSGLPNVTGPAMGGNWTAVIAGGAAIVVAIIAFAGFRKKEAP